MAERRMFAKTIIDSDAFLEMPLSAQALYFHLSMRADDDGFINNPKKIQRMIGSAEDDLKLLIVKNFIIPFESGIVVIKHWKIHNYIQSDRYKQTVYQEEKNLLEIKKNRAYTLNLEDVSKMDTKCIQNGYSLETQVRLGKDRLDKNSINICASDNAPKEPEPPKEPKVSKKDIEDFFEKVWKLYPNKKGKGQVSDAKKKKLYDIGYDEIERAIKRYQDDLAKEEDWRKPQNGSTFFNSGYVDYLDANYVPLEVKPTGKKEIVPDWMKKKNGFNNYEQRDNDYDDLERKLLGQSMSPELQERVDNLKERLGHG